LMAGRPADASDLADRALALARGQHERPNEALGLRLRAEVAAQDSPPRFEDAIADYRQARAVAKVLGMRPLVAHCQLGLGEVLARAGSLEDARAELGEASQLFRSMEMRMGLARADA